MIPALAVTVGPELVSAARDAEQASRDDAALEQVTELRTAVADWQVFFVVTVADHARVILAPHLTGPIPAPVPAS